MATVQQSVDVAELGAKSKDQLLDMAESVGLSDGASLANLRREELLSRILQTASSQQALIASGILEIMDEGTSPARCRGPALSASYSRNLRIKSRRAPVSMDPKPSGVSNTRRPAKW